MLTVTNAVDDHKQETVDVMVDDVGMLIVQAFAK